MGVQRFLADSQFLRQIVHGHTAESVTKKVRSRRIDDSLPARITPSSGPRFVCPFHIRDSFSTTLETNPVYLVSQTFDRPHPHEQFAGKMLGTRKNDMMLVELASPCELCA